MARITGRANPAAGYNPGRVPWVDVTVTSRTASSATVRFQVGSDPGSGSMGTFSGTLKVNNSSYAVSGSVSGGSAVFWTKSVTYNQASAFTLSISLTGSIPGTSAWQSTTLSGTFKVPAGTSGSKPSAPTNLKATRTSASVVRVTFTKGSGATKTQIAISRNGAGVTAGPVPSGGSQDITGITTDSWYRFWAQSWNDTGGSSAMVGSATIYTTPKTPGKPSLASGAKVSWSLPASYVHGVEVKRNDGSIVDLPGRVTSWTDPVAQKPDTTYTVRCWAGPSSDEAKTYSAWSPVSEAALAAFYKPPAITALKAVRANSSGTPTQMGTYLRVTWSGKVESVKDGTTELNKMTRTIRWRKTGTSTWSQSVISDGVAPAAWTNAGVTVGAGAIAVTDTFEVEAVVTDAWQTTVQAATVSTATVAMSLSKTGVGVGKVWQQGALDVGGDAYISGRLHVGEPDVITITGTRTLYSGDSAPGTSATQTQSFDQTFATPPVVVVTPMDARLTAAARTITTTDCRLQFLNVSSATVTGPINVYWIAIGNPA